MADNNGSNNNNAGNNNTPQQQQEGQQQQNGDGDTPMIEYVLRWLLMFMAIQYVTQSWNAPSNRDAVKPNDPTGTVATTPKPIDTTTTGTDDTTLPRKPRGVDPQTTQQQQTTTKKNQKCLWPLGTPMDMDVYFSEESHFSPRNTKKTLAHWRETDLVFGSFLGNERNETVTLPISERVWENETHIYAHVYLTRRVVGASGDIDRRRQRKEDVLYKRTQLTKYRRRKKKREVKNLLGTEDESSDDPSSSSVPDHSVLGKAAQNTTIDVTLLYIKPSLNLQLVDFAGPVPSTSLPPQVTNHMDFPFELDFDEDDDEEKTNKAKAKTNLDFYPIVYPSEFWIKTDDLVIVNGTLASINVDVTFTTIKFWKWQLMSSMEQQWRTQDAMSGDDTESDFIRSILHDTNPWLLAVTAIVSILHSVFDFLAFKNDITFFRKKKSMEGLSLRSMVVNTFFQVVIFLYLFDNDTSFMILMSNGLGLLIEFWKISRAIKFSFKDGGIVWEERDKGYQKSRTKEYDEIATSHLLYGTMPLVAGYGIYSLVYVKHKSWYSWILNTLVGFIYMFGFVMMTPQLFINYKLQSVAHLNWRTMTYKSVNTFIDDLFAFVIKMPIMHRIACLRDDLIFFIFLYQRRIYKTDYSRVNEYGQCAMPTEEMKKELEEEEKNNQQIMTPKQADGTLKKRRSAKDKVEVEVSRNAEKGDNEPTKNRRSAREKKE